jgi:NhaP-type Na+/H+ or K+/H+ antiporter
MLRIGFPITLSLFAVLALSGCGETTTSRAGSGALMGAAGGAAIGAGAGLLGGYLFDQHRRGNID